MRLSFWAIFLLAICFISCSAPRPLLIDKNATKETKILYHNLHQLSKTNILFGHQHATEYGHGWSGEADRSDVKSVVGSHPAVIGVDFSGFSGRSQQAIEAYKKQLTEVVKACYDRGGIITVAWHFSISVTNAGLQWRQNDSIRVVEKILPGGSHHLLYKEILASTAQWILELKGSDGQPIPLIFRPYHEMDGSWFWWGKPQTSRDDFVSLWQFTTSFLRDTMEVHQLIYAFSPDNKFRSEAEYLERFPGNQWVDMVGMDNYGDLGRDRYAIDTAAYKLKIVSDYGKKHGKLAAFTETGLESIPKADWWTEVLLKTLRKKDLNLSYVLVWRNDISSPTHYYAPYPGQISEENFRLFYNDDFTLFQNDLRDIYHKKIRRWRL